MPPATCLQRRRYYRVHTPPVEWGVELGVPDTCTCNEHSALCSRLLRAVPIPHGRWDRYFRQEMKVLARKCWRNGGPVEAFSFERVVSGYAGRLRGRYERALHELGVCGVLSRRHARISAFVKGEKFPYEEGAWMCPRLIEARTPEYNLGLGRFIKPLEERVYRIVGTRDQHVEPSRLLAKGLTARDRAALIRRKWGQFARPAVLMLDFSRFDMHVSVGQLRASHGFYLKLLNDPEFQRLLEFRLENRGVTSTGIRFKCRGRRMTGDMDTALGNSLIALAMLRAACKRMRLGRWDLLVDGDDCLLFLEQEHVERVREGVVEACLGMGHELKAEGVARKLAEIKFCQCHVLELSSGWTMVRDPRKVVLNLAASHKHYGTPGGLRVLKSIAMCELACSSGVPIVQEYCVKLIEALEGVRPSRLDVTEEALVRLRAWLGKGADYTKSRASEVTQAARANFFEAFGIDEAEQLGVESRMGQISREDLKLFPKEPLGDIWLVGQTKKLSFVG